MWPYRDESHHTISVEGKDEAKSSVESNGVECRAIFQPF